MRCVLKNRESAKLDDYRQSIDNIDAALVFLLAERFRITDKVGNLKRTAQLPPEDSEREQWQIERLIGLSENAGLKAGFIKRFMHVIISEVKNNHTTKLDEE